MHEWMDFAESGLAVHQQAQQRAENMHFWICALPTITISATAAVLSLVWEGDKQGSIVICALNALNAVLIGIANFWKWAAEAEKNRFAAQEYDALHEQLNLYKAQMELGQENYENVLSTIEQRIHEVKKQCGPPPRALVNQYKQRRAMADVKMAHELQITRANLQTNSTSTTRRFCCSHRMCCKRAERVQSETSADGDSVALRIIDRKLQEIGRDTSESTMKTFGEDFWLRFRFAAQKKEAELARSLLEMVPTCVSNRDFIKYDQNQRSPLHHAVFYQFWDLLDHLLEGQAGELALWQDKQLRMPFEFIKPEDVSRPESRDAIQRLLVASFKSLCRLPKKDIRRGDIKQAVMNGVRTVVGHEGTSVSSALRDSLRDSEGFGLAHMAAEHNHGDIMKELLDSPFCVSPFDGLSCTFDKRDPQILQRWRDMGCSGVCIQPPHTPISVAACTGSHLALKAMFSYLVRQADKSAFASAGNHALRVPPSRHRSDPTYTTGRTQGFPISTTGPTAPDESQAVDGPQGDDVGTSFWDVRGCKHSNGTRLLTSASNNILQHVYDNVKTDAKAHNFVPPEKVNQFRHLPLIGNFRTSVSFLYNCIGGDAIQMCLEMFKSVVSGPSSHGETLTTSVTMLHYACLFGQIKLVKAILITDPKWGRDEPHGLTPYDYAVLRYRALKSEEFKQMVEMDPSLITDTVGVMSILLEHAAEAEFNHGYHETVMSQRSSVVWEDYKRFQATGQALHWACMLGLGAQKVAVKAILQARSKAYSNQGKPLSLTQIFSKGRIIKAGSDAKSSCANNATNYVMGMSPLNLAVKNDQKEVIRQLFAAASRVSSGELLELMRDLNRILEEDPDIDDGRIDDKKTDAERGVRARLLSVCLSERQTSTQAASTPKDHQATESGDECVNGLDEAPKYKDLFNIMFNVDELGEEIREAICVQEEIKAISDCSYLVSVPCDMFTFGCEQYGRTRGKYYYEVEFGEECPCFGGDDAPKKDFASLYIGWATDNFSNGSKDHVGRYPISWSFCPWDHWDTSKNLRSKKNPGVWLNGQKKRVTMDNGKACKALGGARSGVGCCVDLGANRIAWRIFWPKEVRFAQSHDGSPRDPEEAQRLRKVSPSDQRPDGLADLEEVWEQNGFQYVWVYAPSRDNAHAGINEARAWNNMGRHWAEKDSQVFPCLSASVNCRIEDMCTLHMSGDWCIDPPPGFLPAVSELTGTANVSGETTLPVVPMKSTQGNTNSQRDGKRDTLSLLHLCAVQGTPGVEVAERLARKYDVPYVPLFDGKAEEFHASMLHTPVYRDDTYTRPYHLAMRHGANSAKGIEHLEKIHEDHLQLAQHRWEVRLGWKQFDANLDKVDKCTPNNGESEADEATTLEQPMSSSHGPSMRARRAEVPTQYGATAPRTRPEPISRLVSVDFGV
jgi:ankyrin repeat protein